jgi:hypothetical protein
MTQRAVSPFVASVTSAFYHRQLASVAVDAPSAPYQPLRVVTAGRTYLEVVMRMLLKAVYDTEATNELFRGGEVWDVADRMLERIQPQAFYGFVENGQRAIFAVFDLVDPSEIPVICEPFYHLVKGKITLTPCMNLKDLKKGIRDATFEMQFMQGQSPQ